MSKPILVVKCLRYLYSKTKRLGEVTLCCFETNVLLCHNEIHLCLSNLTSSHGMRAVNLKKGDVINSIRQPVCRPKTLFNPRVSGLSILFNYGQICTVSWKILNAKVASTFKRGITIPITITFRITFTQWLLVCEDPLAWYNSRFYANRMDGWASHANYVENDFIKLLLTISFADQNKNEPSSDGLEPLW